MWMIHLATILILAGAVSAVTRIPFLLAIPTTVLLIMGGGSIFWVVLPALGVWQ